MLTNGIISAIGGRDTLRPLDIWLGPSQVVYVKLNTINNITIFINLGLFRHFEIVTNIRTWIKSHKFWRML
jgi:hypothetical protein